MEAGKGFKNLLWNFYTKNILLAIGIAVVLIFGLLWWLGVYTHHNQAITVPDVKGLQIDEASQALSKDKLRYQVVDSVYSRTTAPGAIVEQLPAANAKVKENRIIFLTINARSQKKVAVPDLRDNSYRQVVATLEALGFKVVDIVRKPSAYKDLVLDVTYNGRSLSNNKELPYGSGLTILVGNGEPKEVADSTIIIEEKEESWF
ncbi:MAG: PASTA domain-containing protein [Bacteroidales bacterium]